MEWHRLTIRELERALSAGEATTATLTEHYLSRIDALDRAGPQLRAFIETDPHALARATELDTERREQGARGPLHGIPIGLKDNLDSGDGMVTSAGSQALAGHRAAADAFVVTKLRAAGALLLGKTNMSEWANFRSTRSSSGWSSRGGQCRNPYALDRSPVGSSSGSGVAVAAGLVTAAIGTETDGSIIAPAAAASLVGLKPTVGLVSRSGIIPISASQDTAGPMARSVADAAILLGVMAGEDPDDPATHAAPRHDYLANLREDALAGARLGVVRSCFGRHEGVDAVIGAALTRLRELGAELVDGIELPAPPELREAERTVMACEFKAGLNAYLANHPQAPVRSLSELIAFNRQHAERVMPFFGQELLERAEASDGLADGAYAPARALCLRLAREEGIDRVLAAQRLDALVAPSNSPTWVIDPIVGDRNLGGCSQAAAVAGYPHLTVPAGYLHGLPLGLSFFGAPWQEAKLLGYGYAFERATRVRREPTFAPQAGTPL
jgi:amidase